MKIRSEIDLKKIWQSIFTNLKKFRIEHFLLLIFAAHMLQIGFPSEGKMVFDEKHYVPASVKTLEGVAANAEHPPLPKIIGAIGIALLGNNWFGWRFPQVIMQILALYLFYLIAKRLIGNPWASAATMLLALDTVFFIHGGLLLIDMPSFLFGFLAIELYFRKRYWLSATGMGLALLAREMSIFILFTLAAYHFMINRKKLKPAMKTGVSYILITTLVFGSLLFVYDAAYLPPKSVKIHKTVQKKVFQDINGSAISTSISTSETTISGDLIWNPVDHVLFIAKYHGPEGIVINKTYAPYQNALNWILPNDPFNSPTYYRIDVSVKSQPSGEVIRKYAPINYVSQANLTLWYGFWIAVTGLLYAMLTRRQTETAFFIFIGIISNYLPWLGLSMLVRRIGFNYYMIYTLPFIALGIAFTWKLLPRNIGLKIFYIQLFLATIFFIYFFPVHP